MDSSRSTRRRFCTGTASKDESSSASPACVDSHSLDEPGPPCSSARHRSFLPGPIDRTCLESRYRPLPCAGSSLGDRIPSRSRAGQPSPAAGIQSLLVRDRGVFWIRVAGQRTVPPDQRWSVSVVCPVCGECTPAPGRRQPENQRPAPVLLSFRSRPSHRSVVRNTDAGCLGDPADVSGAGFDRRAGRPKPRGELRSRSHLDLLFRRLTQALGHGASAGSGDPPRMDGIPAPRRRGRSPCGVDSSHPVRDP